MAVLAAAFWFSKNGGAKFDRITLCLLDQPPPSVTVTLLDITDELTRTERDQIANEIERLRDAVPRFGRFELYAITDAVDSSLEPEIAICNPGRGSEVSPIYENPEIAEKRWKDSFRLRLDQTLERVEAASPGKRSPIMESIKAVSIRPLGSPALERVDKRLVVISDLLQNIPGEYSQYSRPLQSFSSFSANTYSVRTRSDLRGTSVTLLYLLRGSTMQLQDKAHLQFWVDYFEASGATLGRVKKLTGA